jgi:hypothetical protein
VAEDALPAQTIDTSSEASQKYNQNVATHQTLRPRAAVARFFEGLELVDQGIEQWHQWRPDPAEPVDPELKSGHAGVARKP